MGTDKKPALEESKVDFSHASGRHLVRFGSGLRHNTSEGLRRVNNDNGYWTFTAARTTLSTVKNSGDAFASFLLGLPATFTQKSSAPNDFVVTTFDAWVQDDWKITRRLTLNLGLRYDPWLPARDTKGYTAGFLAGTKSTVAPLAPLGLVFGGDAGIPPSIIGSDWRTFAPRAGFAWDVCGNGKTIVRASYGIFRFSTEFFGMLNNLGNGMPFRSASVSITNPPSTADPYANYGPIPFPYTQPASLATYAFGSNLAAQAFDVNTKPGYNQSWNFTVERQVARDTALTISYVGNHAIDIITRYAANPAIYGPGATTGNENSRRLYKGFGDLLLGGSAAYSNYEALQTQLTKRTAHGLTVLANYTYGKAMSIDSSGSLGTATGSGPHNPLNRRADYGPADYDVTHNFKLTFIYDLPAMHRGPSALRSAVNGWQVNSIVNARTGLPFTCRSGVDNSLSSVGLDTCDQINPNSARPAGADFMKTWFNTAAFTTNAIGTFGNTGRNILRRPGMFTVNTSVFRHFRITERLRSEFRVEAFNVLNRANFDLFYSPGSYQSSEDVTSPNFGQITHAHDPRLIQFALKLKF